MCTAPTPVAAGARAAAAVGDAAGAEHVPKARTHTGDGDAKGTPRRWQRDSRTAVRRVISRGTPGSPAERAWRLERRSAKLSYPGARRQQPHWGTLEMAEIEDNVDRELFRNVEKLRQLRIEHRDLDEVISRLSLDLHVDQLQLKRLKKRKLMLKDQIARLESQLIPDLNA